MAYITSSKYKELIYDEESEQFIDIIINGTTIDGDAIRSLSYKDDVFENNYFSLGSAIKSQFEIEIADEALEEFEEINEMTFQFRLKIDADEYETIPLKNYLIKSKEQTSEGYTKYTLTDYMEKFEQQIDFSDIVPCTRYHLLQTLCERCGVQLENEYIINGTVETSVYDNTITARTWISSIAERAGGFAKINRNNKLQIKTFNEVDNVELPASLIGDYSTDEQKNITGVIYENSLQKFEFGDKSGETIFLSQDNPFTCEESEVENIYLLLKDLKYQTLDARVWGDPSIDTGDIITFGDVISFAQPQWNWGNGFYGNYKTDLSSETKQASIVSKVPTSQKIKRLQSNIDEVNGEITTLIKEAENQQTQISKVTQTVDNIQNLFQITGGSNMIKNSAFLFDLDYWELDESEPLYPSDDLYSSDDLFPSAGSNGICEYGYDDQLIGTSTSVSKVKLNNKAIKTSENNITDLIIGKQYTLTYKVKNDINSTGVITLFGNNVEYTQTYRGKLDWKEYSFSFIATSSAYKLTLENSSSMNDYTYFSDIRIRQGDTGIWEPAIGEIYSTVIKLSQQGLQIYSTGSDIATLMTSQGFQIRRYANGNLYEIVTEFTGEGLKTKMASAEEIQVNKYDIKTISYNSNETLIIYKKESD